MLLLSLIGEGLLVTRRCWSLSALRCSPRRRPAALAPTEWEALPFASLEYAPPQPPALELPPL